MPLYLLIPAAQIFFIIHAARTGRPYYWLMIIFFIPMFGILAYIVFELLPGASRSPASRKALWQCQEDDRPTGRLSRVDHTA